MHEATRARALEGWLADARGDAVRQRPEEQLLAEHQLMLAALAAMEVEAKRLLHGEPLRPDFWRGVVEFIGNFSHRVHRVKEERFFFPALEAWGLIEPETCRHIGDDHESLKELTWLLCDGVNEGDWEKAFRVVSMYLARMRAHLEAEEHRMTIPELAQVDDERVGPVRAGFAAIEAEELGSDGRLEYFDITRSLCRDVGIEPPGMRGKAWP